MFSSSIFLLSTSGLFQTTIFIEIKQQLLFTSSQLLVHQILSIQIQAVKDKQAHSSVLERVLLVHAQGTEGQWLLIHRVVQEHLSVQDQLLGCRERLWNELFKMRNLMGLDFLEVSTEVVKRRAVLVDLKTFSVVFSLGQDTVPTLDKRLLNRLARLGQHGLEGRH